MGASEVQNATQSSGTWGSLRNLQSCSAIRPVSPCPRNVRQHRNHLLHERAGAGKRSLYGTGVSRSKSRCQYCVPSEAQTSWADGLSGHFAMDHEWELHDSVVNSICAQWGTLTRDVLASQTGHAAYTALGECCDHSPEAVLSSFLGQVI